jgi:hypothetical protein
MPPIFCGVFILLLYSSGCHIWRDPLWTAERPEDVSITEDVARDVELVERGGSGRSASIWVACSAVMIASARQRSMAADTSPGATVPEPGVSLVLIAPD